MVKKPSYRIKGAEPMIVIGQANGDANGREISITILMYEKKVPAAYHIIYSVDSGGIVVTEQDVSMAQMKQFYLGKKDEFPSLRWNWTKGFSPPAKCS